MDDWSHGQLDGWSHRVRLLVPLGRRLVPLGRRLVPLGRRLVPLGRRSAGRLLVPLVDDWYHWVDDWYHWVDYWYRW